MEDLLQSAVKLKQAETEGQRRRFMQLPPHQQNTLFHADEARVLRWRSPSVPLEDRLAASVALKALGRAAVARADALPSAAQQRSHLLEATHRYEEAYSVFRFVAAIREDWKSRGIQDADLSFHLGNNNNNDDGDSSDDIVRSDARVRAHVASVLCSYALCCRRCAGRDGDAVAALLEVRGFAPSCLRAAFLLAKALTEPPTATTVQLRQAIRELDAAVRLHGEGAAECARDASEAHACGELLARLRGEWAAQDARDRRAFGGMFQRRLAENGDAGDAVVAPPRVEPEAPRWELLIAQLAIGRRAIATALERGAVDEARELAQQLSAAAAERLFADVMAPRGHLCFEDPTPEVAAAAAALGLDLARDEAARAELARRRQQQSEGADIVAMHPLDVEMALWVAGRIAEPELCRADASQRREKHDFERLNGPPLGARDGAGRTAELRAQLRDWRRESQ